MKRYLFFICSSVLLFSCQEKPKPLADTADVETEFHPELYGSWSGSFYVADEADFDFQTPDKLNIIIKRITKDTVLAQNILAGKITPLVGRFEENNRALTLTLDQPKNEKENGYFEVHLVKDTLIGSWTPYRPSNTTFKMNFKLLKKVQKYDPNLMLPAEGGVADWNDYKMVKYTDTAADGTITQSETSKHRSATDQIAKINASTTVLREDELKNLRKLELEIIRNTIFARHGYAFKKRKVRAFFDSIDWYIPTKTNIDNELTPIEKANIKLLSRFEKYATDTYDAVGR